MRKIKLRTGVGRNIYRLHFWLTDYMALHIASPRRWYFPSAFTRLNDAHSLSRCFTPAILMMKNENKKKSMTLVTLSLSLRTWSRVNQLKMIFMRKSCMLSLPWIIFFYMCMKVHNLHIATIQIFPSFSSHTHTFTSNHHHWERIFFFSLSRTSCCFSNIFLDFLHTFSHTGCSRAAFVSWKSTNFRVSVFIMSKE